MLKITLKTAREKAGLTQDQVAKRFGWQSAQFVSNWERGISYPPIAIIKRLARLYKTDSGALFEQVLRLSLIATEKSMRDAFTRSRL